MGDKNMKKIAFAMNFPWSLIGLIYGLLLFPEGIKIDKLQSVIIVRVRRLWINDMFLGRKVRGFALGNTVILSSVADSNTIDHEIVHVRQFVQKPFIFPLLYCFESIKNGYRGNKYEKEAYRQSNKPA